ncbi:MAG: amidohydrolase family protein [Acidimicrobiia bacterium]
MANRTYRIISADGHVIEPPDMWTRFLPKKHHDRAPRLVKDPAGGDAWDLGNGSQMPMGLVTNTGEWGKRYEDNHWYGASYDTIRQGAFDGKARIEEQDIDGIDAEFIYPSQRTMGVFMAQPDDDFHLDGIEAYNTWVMTEFAAADPDRLFPLCQMPAVDSATAVKAVRNAKSAGFKGVIISGWPSGNATLSDDDDPFFEACEEEQLPVHIHSGLSHSGLRKNPANFATARARAGGLPGLQQMGGAIGQASEPLSALIYSGLFDRYPDLKLVLVECGAGWIPHHLEHMNDHWWRNRVWTDSKLKMLPADYWFRNCLGSFIREIFAVQTRHYMGVDNLMWANDYPHHRHDWPYSRRIIDESMMGVPDEEKHKMICGNAMKLYGLE